MTLHLVTPEEKFLEAMHSMKQIIVVGNPVDGFAYWGPFDSTDEAVKMAERQFDDEWWIVDLLPIIE